MTDSLWRRSMLVTAVRELDGRCDVIVQGDQAMPPIRLRHGDSCCLAMRFEVGGVELPPQYVWITTTEPRRLRASTSARAPRRPPGGVLAWLRRLLRS